MTNNKGSVMIDFIFGMTVTVGVSFILLALCFTMAMVEVSQYIAFASSRAYFSGHTDKDKQKERGQEKFDKLMTLRPFKGMLKDSDWFKLTFVKSGDFTDEYDNVRPPHDNETFFGTQLKFKADVLDLKLPLLDQTSGAFDAIITSYLGREPTTVECLNFEKKRWEEFMLRAGFAQPPGTNPTSDYAVVTDNGC